MFIRSVGQPGRPLGLGPRCREFESLHSDHFYAGKVFTVTRRSSKPE